MPLTSNPPVPARSLASVPGWVVPAASTVLWIGFVVVLALTA